MAASQPLMLQNRSVHVLRSSGSERRRRELMTARSLRSSLVAGHACSLSLKVEEEEGEAEDVKAKVRSSFQGSP
jgi:hypothetical protein